MSIKVKLLILLTLIPVVTLGVYAFIAIEEFKEDKLAYVYDSSSAISSSLSTQVRSKIDVLFGQVRPMLRGYEPNSKKFSAGANDLFRGEMQIDYLAVYHPTGGNYSLGGKIQKRPQGGWVEGSTGLQYVSQAARGGLSFSLLGNDYAIFAFRNGDIKSPNHTVVFSIIRVQGFSEGFQKSGAFKNYLVSGAGNIITGPEGSPYANFSDWDFAQELREGSYTERTLESLSPDGFNMLASYDRVGFGDLYVLSLVKKEDALVAADILLTKSLIFFVAIVAISFFISILASSKLTAALRHLIQATRRVADGDYDINIEVKTKDEVGYLANSFNGMAGEVSRLMKDNVEKARMEKELETAKAVQETLFPESVGNIDGVEISGYYTSASECGGDWWHYCEMGNKVYLWIGDATGHGAPAALITSAAKSVASVVETMHEGMSPAKAMSMLNTSIHQNSKGQICMTFFIGSLDKETGELTYCNASHEPPIRIPDKGGELKKMDLEPIMGESDSRLGESIDSVYNENKLQLEKGDSIFFYTDGVTELYGSDETMFEERRLLRSLVKGTKRGEGISGAMSQLHDDLEEFRNETPLEDDVTYFLAKYN